MAEGTADGRWYDHREARTESGMDQDLRGKTGGSEGQEEQRHKDNAAANAEQAGQKTSQAAEDDKKKKGSNTERAHNQPKQKQVSHIAADLLILEAPTRFELVMEILQTSALPLGDGAIEKRES